MNAISHDTLRCVLHPPPLAGPDTVTSIAASIFAFVDGNLPHFIWHRDSFDLKVVKNPDSDAYLLQGTMRVGDSVDDEWLVVWLLKQISQKWDLVISSVDSDGEFLLIEAAEALPSWVKPSNSENRVWIYDSRLHLVPLSHTSPPSTRVRRRKLPGLPESDDEGLNDEDDSEWISADDALKLVRDPNQCTFASAAVEKLVWKRISGYPAALKNHVHVTKAWIPIDIARALVDNPALVQRAVETFYTRDAIQLRAAHRMSRFPPHTSVLRPVVMTRTAYAQLVGQKFFPPKVFGRWKENEGTTEWRWRDVGMKIAVGFEMLFQETKNRHDAVETAETAKSAADASKDALRRDPHYINYLQNLAETNYFRGEIQGSELWQTLEDNAVAAYINARREDSASRPSFSSQVNLAISRVPSLPEVPDQEYSDEWLNIDVHNFDELLEKTMGLSKPETDAMDVDVSKAEAEDRLASSQAAKLKALATKVENFVEGEGDVEGAVFEDEQFSDEGFSEEEFSDSEEGSDAMHENDLDEIGQAERQAAMEKLVPALDPSEYGKMPPSFSSSQRVTPITSTQDKPIRPPILPRDKYEGVDSDDESDEEEEDAESEEDRPQVVGEVEIDMAEEEEEFLEFSRQALGISDEQWNEIIRDRKSRGAFLPASATIKEPKTNHEKSPATTREGVDTELVTSVARRTGNQKLDSFEAVMRAMDEELARARDPKPKFSQSDAKDKGKARESATEEEPEQDIEAAMEAELKASLECDEDEEEYLAEGVDYNLIKNFLESFKSQEGLAGPVSSLAGRLQPEWKLPKDTS